MSETFVRKAQPDCMRFIVRKMRSNKTDCGQATATIEQLVCVLMDHATYTKTTATDTIHNAVHDGLLLPIATSPHGSSPRGGRLHDNKLVRLPELAEVQVAEHDFYCFECHLPGMLELCQQCPRSFHRLCYRKDAERPNYTVPSAKLQKNRLPAFSSDTEYNSDEVDDCYGRAASTIIDYESDVRATSSLQALEQTSSAAGFTPQRLEENTVDSTSSLLIPPLTNTSVDEGKPPVIDDYENAAASYDTKTKLEVVCLGEVRPPNRVRPVTAATSASNVSYKSEVTLNEDDVDVEKELCTCCRLLKSAAMFNPPNMEPDELCHLVNFTFSRNRTWVTTDVLCYLEALKLSVKECNVITKLLFKIKPQRLDGIAYKLHKKKYNYLMEFLVDILDFQHNIGVLFGSHGTAFESTKWLVRDITHDLSEIRRCSDCFRYSHEKRSIIWFAKPCVQRHELVFAKHSGFPYWPAKVIRVLPNNKYDVRFFGGKHSRALIDVKFIKSIDSDNRQLKLGSKPGIKKAMEELRYHQSLSTYPPSKFSFHANKEETENIIRTVLGRGVSTGDVADKKRRGRKRKANTNMPIVIVADEIAISEDVYDAGIAEVATRRSGRKTQENITPIKRQTRSAAKPNLAANLEEIKKYQEKLDESWKILELNQKQNDKLREQILRLKEILKKNEIEKKIIKRKQWCYWCLNEAIYLCCFKAAYCSQTCQMRHWKDGHKNVCRNQDDQIQPNNATSTT